MAFHEILDAESNQTVSGSKTLFNPLLSSGICTADPTVALGVVTKQYADGLGAGASARYSGIMNGNFAVWNRGGSFS